MGLISRVSSRTYRDFSLKIMSSNIFKPTKHSRSRPISSRSVRSDIENITPVITPRSSQRELLVPKLDFTKLSVETEIKTTRDERLLEISRPNTGKITSPVIASAVDLQSISNKLSPMKETKSIDNLLNQRDAINQKIKNRRIEKQRLARLKVIEDQKKQRVKEPTVEELEKALQAQQKSKPVRTKTKPNPKPKSKSHTPCPQHTPKIPSTDSSITQ